MPGSLSSYSKTRPFSGAALFMLALLALALAAYYRLPDLGLRPMHTDEAILATKFVDMCKSGRFDYDPADYHGPGLHYITMLYGSFAGWKDANQLSGEDLRKVVAVLGVLSVLVVLLLSDALGRLATGLAMLMLAVSPLQVFFSRYFIMEVPFELEIAIFMIACWRYAKSENVLWIILAGIALGLQHATKETFVINLAAMFAGWLGSQFLSEGFTDRNRSLFLSLGRNRHMVRWPWVWVACVAALVSVALYSGFFRHWDDVGESVTTYLNYLRRSGGAGHEKPFYYYLTVLLYTKDYYTWTEAMVVALAVVGMFHSFTGRFQREEERKAFLVFLSIYSLVSLAAYSIIPYKTPWTIMSVEYALVLLAGVGAQHLFGMFRGNAWKTVCTLGMIGGLYHLCDQAMFSIHDPHRNIELPNMKGPYVYSHTTTTALKLVDKLRALADFQKDAFSAQVINVDNGWPLPWYLRDVKRIGYQSTIPDKVDAPVIVVDASLASAVQARAGSRVYEAEPYGLRQGVNVMLMVDKTVLDAFVKARRSEGAPP